MANSFDNDFTITNIDDLKFQYKKGAAFYHLKCLEFGVNGRNTQCVIKDDRSLATGGAGYEHLSFGNATADQAHSFAFWVKIRDPESHNWLISKKSEEDGWEWWIQYRYAGGEGQIFWEMNDHSADKYLRTETPDLASSIPYKWAHVVLTTSASPATAGARKIYINAISQSCTETLQAGYVAMEKLDDVPVWVGGNAEEPGSENLNGMMTDIAVFDKELSSTEVSELYNLYFNTHYKDLDVLHLDKDGKQRGGYGSIEDSRWYGSAAPGDFGRFIKTPLYNHSAFNQLRGGWTPNGVTGSTGYSTVTVDTGASVDPIFGRGVQIIANIATTGSSANNVLSASMSTVYEPSIQATCDRLMYETGSAFPSDRVADLNAKPTFGLNVPGPGRLRERNTPYKVTKK
jgi:hypothetical protein|tara:strand:+ start:1388 stop:2593 length:1206 start_codon:yes stop_codon:yes gene_type:complete